jgi:hypothetical protein
MFSAINHLLFEKPSPEIDASALDEFSPYMVNRYFSFYSNGAYVDYINATTNTYHDIFNSDEDTYRFFEHVLPKVKKRKIDYVKKNKKQQASDKIEHQVPDFYSKREWNMLTNTEM